MSIFPKFFFTLFGNAPLPFWLRSYIARVEEDGGTIVDTGHTKEVYADVIDYDPTLIQSCDSGKAGTLYSIIPSLSLLNRYSGAAAAYSLRSLSSSTTNVVKVRRDSDDSEQDFTASDITNGTLLSFVNADVEKIVNGDFATDTDWTKGTGWSISGGTANCDGTQTSNSEFKTTVGIAVQGVQVTFSFEVKNYSAGTLNATVEGTGALEFSGINANGVYSTTATSSDPLPKVTFTASSDFIGSIDNVSVIQSTANGFVTTWYDQSGNSNDATNSTAANQPKIVDAGVLVEENGKPAVDFDGVDDDLTLSSEILTDTHYMSMVAANTTKGRILGDNASYNYFLESGATDNRYRINGIIYNLGTRIFQTQELVTWSRITTSSEFFQDGTSINSATVIADDFKFKVIASNLTQLHSDGLIQEIIIYDTDQSSNRVSIEQNINNHYNIY